MLKLNVFLLFRAKASTSNESKTTKTDRKTSMKVMANDVSLGFLRFYGANAAEQET
jgi:hypothetical protein